MQRHRTAYTGRREQADDEAVRSAAQRCGFRPPRSAWRFDLDIAPVGPLLYVRRQRSTCVMVAYRDARAWYAVTRDGECRAIRDVASWCPIKVTSLI